MTDSSTLLDPTVQEIIAREETGAQGKKLK